MSLLNRATDTVTVFPEVVVPDSDGNKLTKPSAVGVVCRAVVQPLSSTEDTDGTSSKHRLRLIGWPSDPLGAQSAVEWNGNRYAVDGDALVYNSSRATARTEYRLIRK